MLVDSCIIIEAFRVGSWKSLTTVFDVETVEKCIEEACTGDLLDPKRVPIKHADLIPKLAKRHLVTNVQLAALAIDRPDMPALDAGELHLMAWVNANPNEKIQLLFASSDKAAVRATNVLEWLDKVVSLEAMIKKAGAGKKNLGSLRNHFREQWLVEFRTEIRLGLHD